MLKSSFGTFDSHVSSLKQNLYQGWLIKHVRTLKFFQSTRFPRRYFVIDKQQGTLTIKEDEKKKGSKTIVPFREIVSCEKGKPEPVLDKECEWKYVFVLFTIPRPYRLYARTEAERTMWLDVFSTIVRQRQSHLVN